MLSGGLGSYCCTKRRRRGGRGSSFHCKTAVGKQCGPNSPLLIKVSLYEQGRGGCRARISRCRLTRRQSVHNSLGNRCNGYRRLHSSSCSHRSPSDFSCRPRRTKTSLHGHGLLNGRYRLRHRSVLRTQSRPTAFLRTLSSLLGFSFRRARTSSPWNRHLHSPCIIHLSRISSPNIFLIGRPET